MATMGLFWKSPKPNPKINVDGIEFVFDRDLEYWSFAYCKTEFQSFGPALTVPAKAELDAILRTVESLLPEMKSRLKAGLVEWEPSLLDGRETYTVVIQQSVTPGSFEVSWSSESWGDLGADFTVNDGAILDEQWGD